MKLSDRLKDATVDYLKDLNLNFPSAHTRENVALVSSLYNEKVIDNKTIEDALEEAVIKTARKDYTLVTKKGSTIYPDHVTKPEFLAYAIDKGEFSKKELKRIPFDHGEDAKEFAKHYGVPELLTHLRMFVLDPYYWLGGEED